jgi:hypothetical protein
VRVVTLCHSGSDGWRFDGAEIQAPQLVIWFADYARARAPGVFDGLKQRFPQAVIAGCTTNGEIYRGEAMEGACVAAAVRFDSTDIKARSVAPGPGDDAREAGVRLARELVEPGLKAVYILSDAFSFNGADLVEGLIEALPKEVVLAGGMAGDGAALLSSTLAGLNEPPRPGVAVGIGFYGSALRVGQGVAGGWDPLGPSRHVTRSEGATVFELDGQPALDLYERLVGDASTLARLRHPFAFKSDQDTEQDVIREVVGVDKAERSITFIDKVPQGWWGQILRGADDRLVDGASLAARRAGMNSVGGDALGLVVSCIGRKWVMGQRIGDETEALQDEAPQTPTIGFYSYGEIAPHERTGRCTLHHASVSVTVLSEAA